MTLNQKGGLKARPEDACPLATDSASDSSNVPENITNFEPKHKGITVVARLLEDRELTPNELAFAFAGAGIPVFPTSPTIKKPLNRNGHNGATTDPIKINRWWKEHPDAMVGIPTGEASGVWVYDLDKKAGTDGRENARSLWEAETGDSGAFDAFLFDGTLVISTPSGGYHVYFTWPGGRNIRNSAGQIAVGIDVRGEGGYVIAPGSVNAAGKRYELESFGLEICAAPEWLSDRAENPKSKKPKPSKENDIGNFDLMEAAGHGVTQRSREALAEEIDRLSNAIEGTRNDRLNAAAFNLFQLVKDGELDEKIVRGYLTHTARELGLNLPDIKATLNSAWKKAKPRSEREGGAPIAKAEAVASGTPWPAPDLSYGTRIDLPVPTFPRDAFGRCADLLEEAARSKSAPVGWVAGGVLAGVSTLIQNSRDCQVRPEWIVPPIVFVVNAGEAGTNKSPGMKPVLDALEAVQKDINAFYPAEHAAWVEACKIAEFHHKAWVKAGQVAANEIAVGNVAAVPPEPANAKPPKEPLPVELKVSSFTFEKLIKRKSDQCQGLMLDVDELSGLLVKIARKDHSELRGLLLSCYDASSFTLDQIKTGNAALHAQRMGLTVIGNIQPEKLAPILAEADDGLIGRCDFVFARKVVPAERFRGSSVDFAPAFRKLDGLARGADGPVILPMTDEADAAIFAMEREIEELMEDQPTIVRGWLGKAAGKAARYALLFAHLDYAVGHAEEPTELNAGHVGRARTYVLDYLFPMLCRVIGEASLPGEETCARTLFRLLRQKYNPGQLISARDIRLNNRSGLKETKIITEAFTSLEYANVVRRERHNEGPAPRWAVNPAIWDADPADA